MCLSSIQALLTTWIGTYYWYMYLLDLNAVSIPGLKKGRDQAQVSTPEAFSKERDIEATAGTSSST